MKSLVATMEAVQGLNQRVEVIEQQAAQANAGLMALPGSTAPPVSTRAQINQIVRQYAVAYSIPEERVFGRIYYELKYRYHFDAKSCHRGPRENILDVVERKGRLNDMLQVAILIAQQPPLRFVEGGS